ncbi:MAG TPA: maltose alpha-D-glucosyltransferase [Vicinamibacterales bacterium]|nr:maltose alpha-D-glucosyltransferase [Vicinamibacterales bacterium]
MSAIEVPNLALPVEAVAPAPSAAEDDPLWYKDAIIYQAHVKSFFDSNNDGIGDFLGLTNKLDYLQGLGVTCIWLLPFFPSPLKDDGYDISDYRSVHPSYGTLEDFKGFVRAAHDRHIKILIELVVNHTSDQHPWFQRARMAPRGSPERDFYVWSDTDQKFPETRIIFLDTEKSNWSYDPVAGQYYWHRFFSHQPDLNHNNPTVVDAVIDVMKFWLDFGVDALRLDAVPYLCVREGTSNENLPETHAVLKRIRRELDAAYKNRMLLAEANQWPSDVSDYFGDGDECHMAFHFPLMPRMFMAIRQEERHAITEILSQTPDIPPTCQWGLFLRNHDELTLEMVTDEERDYMYSNYAADPQMRLNLGIRRRLAPLVENSRRRVELLHGLLFSLPGTPILYYGDEIGMGDNIYLGDRNGVRTPMQWSSDRNGGFSRVDAARLYAPGIQDPVFGFQSINVEAQERYPFSLLNWMKRLIAMRKQHRVFGRGTLELVDSPNRKVFAFLRRDDRETILIVANLSRDIQPVELDLRPFAGLIPVEMNGLTGFPRIADQPYFLTLGPYALYWFVLQQEPMQIGPRVSSTRDPGSAIAEALPGLLVGRDWQNVLDGGTRSILEKQALGPFLQRQRWFASKAKQIRRVQFSDWAPLQKSTNPSFLTIASVEYTDTSRESYLVPLALLEGEGAERALNQAASMVLSRITGARKGVIVDGLYDDGVCEQMLGLIDRGGEVGSPFGKLRGTRVTGLVNLAAERRWVRGSADQSNSVAFVNNQYMLKLFRRLAPGPNPEFEIGRFLTEQSFTRAPRLAGALEYLRGGLEPGTLAVVQEAVENQGNGWVYSIEDVRRYYQRVAARVRSGAGSSTESGDAQSLTAEDGVPPPFFTALEHWYLTGATTLGRRTAELHVTLRKGTAPPFAPEPLDEAALQTLSDEMRAQATLSLDLLAERRSSLNEASRSHADAVLANRRTIVARLDGLRGLGAAGQRIRIHGDYHLGQVLRTADDFVIIDFEGEPMNTIAERRVKQSPLRDVAGMLRSFSYAAYAALFAHTLHAPDDYALLEPWAETWQYWAADAFLTGYRQALGESPLVPRGDRYFALLRAFVLHKALYELGYELNNRPDWVRIPLIGIRKLVERGLAQGKIDRLTASKFGISQSEK